MLPSKHCEKNLNAVMFNRGNPVYALDYHGTYINTYVREFYRIYIYLYMYVRMYMYLCFDCNKLHGYTLFTLCYRA